MTGSGAAAGVLIRITHYLAYGSNMHTGRLRARLSSVCAVEGARLGHHRLTFDKRGRDGSGKCNIVATPDACLFGVLFRLPVSALIALDAIEGRGYVRIAVRPVGLDSGRGYRAWCYRAPARARIPALVPFDWYRSLVVAGAHMHRLPDDYIEDLQCTPTRSDPNRFRRRRGQRLLAPNGGPASDATRGFAPGPKSGWLIDGHYRDRYHAGTPHIAL